MSEHRLVAARDVRVIPTDRPFSNFSFVDREFGGAPSIRRLFSQARSYKGRTVVIEDIPAAGALAEDDAELAGLFSDFRPRGLKRLSFWRESLESPDDISSVEPRSFLGFAILKRDEVPTRDVDRWYVFESVVVKYPHEHNCVPVARDCHVRVYGRDLTVKGVLYCQQNGLNKACAQVALRALLGALHPEEDLSYRQINDWASGDHAGFQPWRGLDV